MAAATVATGPDAFRQRRPALPRARSEDDAVALRLLRSSEHPIVRSFPHGAVFVFDHDLRYLCAGGRGLADVGLSRDALEGRTIFEAFPPTTASVIEPLYRAALAGESTTVDVAYAGRIFTQRLSPLLNDEGAVLAGMGFTQDVTEGRQAEQRLRESEQRFRLAFEHAPIGKAIVDLDGRFREVNPALCRLTGYPAPELRALTFQDITHPDDLDADLEHLGLLLFGTIDNYSMEKRYFTASGGLIWVLLTVSLVLADDGEPMYFVTQVQDITDRKRTEQAIAAAHAQQAAALEHAATHDGLTGLPNRALLQQRLSVLLQGPGRRSSDHGVAVLFCDLDGFKTVNDVHGHETGDAVLREAAVRLTSCARGGDTVARFGGDEFVLLLDPCAGDDADTDAATVARRVCAALAVPFEVAGNEQNVSVSVGIAFGEPGLAPDELLRRADKAMYAAKTTGKNRHARYTAS